ncbi:MAG: macro domain-containing protein [Oscillospiraceae bacterium]|nr:macro domain-containing protein [Oscillospiraceae bacterium]
MPFQIIRHDIALVRADAIVDAASCQPQIGAGVDLAIHKKAGPQLLKARQKIGLLAPGTAAVTPAYGLDAKYVIHAATPHWTGEASSERLLRQAYDECLRLAVAKHCRSIAFPLLASGHHGFPKALALQVAIRAFTEFLTEHELQIILVVFGQESYHLSEGLVPKVASYIREHQVRAWEEECATVDRATGRRHGPLFAAPMAARKCMEAVPCASVSLEEFLRTKDAGFTETLRDLIAQRGLKNSVVYKRANISKQLFSKIINDPEARPTKPTAIALALALELDLPATRDLIGRAGYALTDSSVFDLIIRYFIEQKNYDVIEINIALYDFDQVLLGS